jgi:hypothetical protein
MQLRSCTCCCSNCSRCQALKLAVAAATAAWAGSEVWGNLLVLAAALPQQQGWYLSCSVRPQLTPAGNYFCDSGQKRELSVCERLRASGAAQYVCALLYRGHGCCTSLDPHQSLLLQYCYPGCGPCKRPYAAMQMLPAAWANPPAGGKVICCSSCGNG